MNTIFNHIILIRKLQTIIECLKYSCTGELPPNSKSGQAFIHDTKVTNPTYIAYSKSKLINDEM